MRTKPELLFLQSWYSKITDNWYPWLRQQAEAKGYLTYFPDIPEMRQDVPNMDKILTYLESLNIIHQNLVIVGHSLGNLLAMRLAEKHCLQQLILVSVWDYDDLCEGHSLFWKTKINHSKIKEHVHNISVIHSDNDPYFTALAAEDTSKRLGARYILIKGGGHFGTQEGTTKMPAVLDLL